MSRPTAARIFLVCINFLIALTVVAQVDVRLYNSVYFRWVSPQSGGGGLINVDGPIPSDWERLRLHKLSGGSKLYGGDSVAIQAPNGKFFSALAMGGSEIFADGPAVSSWERFTIFRYRGPGEIRSGDEVCFRCPDNVHWVSSDERYQPFRLRAFALQPSDWEVFRLEIVAPRRAAAPAWNLLSDASRYRSVTGAGAFGSYYKFDPINRLPQDSRISYGKMLDMTRVRGIECTDFVKALTGASTMGDFTKGPGLITNGQIRADLDPGMTILTLNAGGYDNGHTAFFLRRIDSQTIEVVDQNFITGAYRASAIGRHRQIRIGGGGTSDAGRYFLGNGPY